MAGVTISWTALIMMTVWTGSPCWGGLGGVLLMERNRDGAPSWRDFQIWIMETWFDLDDIRECYGLVHDGTPEEEETKLDYI